MAAAAFRLTALALLAAGCTGIAADSRNFENTHWQVTAVNRQPTPVAGNYVIRFERGQIGGQFGCNHFGGPYRISGEMLSTGAMSMTEMACSEPANSFESWGMAVLQQPMRMVWSSGERLALSNGAGSIELEILH